jgi:prophage regulatory protein
VNIPSLEPAKILELSPSNNILKNEISKILRKKQEINMVQNKTDKTLKLIRLSEVIRKTGFGKTWIYKLISAGKFPKQIKIGERAVAFIESEVDEWIYKAITASRNTSN